MDADALAREDPGRPPRGGPHGGGDLLLLDDVLLGRSARGPTRWAGAAGYRDGVRSVRGSPPTAAATGRRSASGARRCGSRDLGVPHHRAGRRGHAAGGVHGHGPLGIVMNGVTGRMGYRQHLCRSVLAIRDEGGVLLPDGTRVAAGADAGRPQTRRSSPRSPSGTASTRWTTDLDEALADPDAARSTSTPRSRAAREKAITAAIAAGKHVYTEKPLAESVEGALELARAGRATPG